MVSMTTKDLLREKHSGVNFHKRYYQFNHHQDLVEAYEVNVHEKCEDELTDIIQYYRTRLGVNRREDRYPVGELLAIETCFGDLQGALVNFSKRGVAIEIDRFLSKGVMGTLSLLTADGILEETLQEEGLLPLVAEIRWGVEVGDGSFRQ